MSYKDLYNKLLQGKITQNDFTQLRSTTNSMTDDELSDHMFKEWVDESIPYQGSFESKDHIHKNLDKYINKPYSLKNWLKIASVILILLSTNLLTYLISENEKDLAEQFQVYTDSGEKASVTLPDNSTVRLNSETNLTYILNKKERKIDYFEGEAFFDITKDPDRPFIINIENLSVEVLGTSFNIKSYKNEAFVETSLISGKVKMNIQGDDSEYFLSPNEKMIYSKEDGKLNIVPLDKDYELGWLAGKLVFRSESLSDILAKLERWYGVEIDLQCNELASDKMTGSFGNQDIHQVLDIIKLQYDIEYVILNNKVILRKSI